MSVAIVGAGIIGLYLAWKLAGKGCRVTIFEKRKEIGGKACSGLISERLKDFIPINNSLIENKIHFCQIRFPKKTVVLNFQPVHLVINRRKLSQQLFSFCRASGVEISFGREVKEIPDGFDRVIGCDGALSLIRKKIGTANPSLLLGLQVLQTKSDFSDYVETWPQKQGFCWKIPRGGQVEYGIIGPVNTAKPDFEKFLQKQGFDVGRQHSEIKAALVPGGLCLPDSEKITVCGDAAGFCKPWSGGGVIWGLCAADILLKTFPDFRQYHKKARQFFQPRILKSRIVLPLVYFLGYRLPFLLPSRLVIDNDFLVKS